MIENFKKLALENRLAHAYLFHGENQDKIFSFVQSLANFLENGNFEKSKELLKETLVILPDEKNTIGIDAIKQIKNFLWQKPVNSSRRLVVINEIQSLTFEAQYAALKIVEEPPQSALIIFIAVTVEDLFPTLNSRLQKIYFPEFYEKVIFENQKTFSQTTFPLNDIEINDFFKFLINGLRKDPLKNSKKLKDVLKRLVLFKQFNVNKRLQIRTLYE